METRHKSPVLLALVICFFTCVTVCVPVVHYNHVTNQTLQMRYKPTPEVAPNAK